MVSPDESPLFIAPFAAHVFKTEYFERNRLLVRRNDAGYFQGVVDISHIDELVTAVRIPPSNFNLALDEEPLPLDAYCVGSTYVDKAKVLALHQEGATIILRAVEQWSPALNRLRIMAEQFFKCECQINVYLTPPRNKSTPPHWDTHDLIVMQIAGSKRWRLFEGERTLPLSDERFEIGKEVVSAEYEELVLDAGDTLYLPRGVIHEPVAETYSVHVSIGVHTLRWFDVLNLALLILANREGSVLRTGVPLADDDAGYPADSDIASQLLDPVLLAQARKVLRRKFELSQARDHQGRLLHISRETG